MNVLTDVFKSPQRPLYLILLGLAASAADRLFLPYEALTFEMSFIKEMLFAGIIGTGIAIEAGIPRPRLRYTLLWCAAGAFASALVAPASAGAGRFLLGAGIGIAIAAPGALHPVPWVGAMKGAAGAAAGALLAHFAGANGAPHWILPGIESLMIGLALAQGRGERLLIALNHEVEKIRAPNNPELRIQADRIIALAVQSVEEIDANEERTGEDRSETRTEVAAAARRGLGLLRRLARLAMPDAAIEQSLREKTRVEEEKLVAVYQRELAATLNS